MAEYSYDLKTRERTKEFLDFLHEGISLQNKIYFSMMQLRGSQAVNRFYTDSEKAVEWVENSSPYEFDTYYSVNEFNCPKRDTQHIFRYASWFFDIDIRPDMDKKLMTRSVNKFIGRLSWCIEKGFVLMPNYINFSGRGLHLIYTLDKPLPNRNLSWLYSKIAENIAECLEGVTEDLADNKDIKYILDPCYKDAARVLRLPMTVNTKSNNLCRILYHNNKKYSIEQMREFAEIPDKLSEDEKRERQQHLKTARENVKFINTGLKLHSDRLSDLLLLIKIRNGNVTGKREIFLFLICYYNSFSNIEYNDDLLKQVNNSFTEPLNKNEIHSAKSGERQYYKWVLEKKSGYNYYNKTLIKLLEITEEEQVQLKTIISKEEKARRRAEKKQWGHEKRENMYQETRKNINQQINKMLDDKKTFREIAEELNVSFGTISKVADKKSEKERKEKLVLEMLKENMTYREIEKEVNISHRDIAKIRKKLC